MQTLTLWTHGPHDLNAPAIASDALAVSAVAAARALRCAQWRRAADVCGGHRACRAQAHDGLEAGAVRGYPEGYGSTQAAAPGGHGLGASRGARPVRTDGQGITAHRGDRAQITQHCCIKTTPQKGAGSFPGRAYLREHRSRVVGQLGACFFSTSTSNREIKS